MEWDGTGAVNDEAMKLRECQDICGGASRPPRTFDFLPSTNIASLRPRLRTYSTCNMSLDAAFRRLAIQPATVCRECRRSIASSARRGQQPQSATAAFAGMYHLCRRDGQCNILTAYSGPRSFTQLGVIPFKITTLRFLYASTSPRPNERPCYLYPQ